MTKGIYAGSFDPITSGHIDIIKRSMFFCKELVVAIGINPNKKTMFNEQERLQMINQVISKELEFLTSTNVKAMTFSGLIADFAKEVNASILIRGIRSVSDFEYEINLANVNKTLSPGLETVFLPTSPDMAVISSSTIKTVAQFGGNIEKFAPPYITEKVKNKFVKFEGKVCPKCKTSDHFKITDDQPSFLYCRKCGVMA